MERIKCARIVAKMRAIRIHVQIRMEAELNVSLYVKKQDQLAFVDRIIIVTARRARVNLCNAILNSAKIEISPLTNCKQIVD